MNDSSLTFKETEGKDSAEGDNWQLLVVLVAVMGTLMGVVVILGGVWVCVMCSRRSSRLAKRNSRGQERAFPPVQREMVELGWLPASLRNHRLDSPPRAINDYSGISGGLGLGVSYPTEHIPSPPTPHSWTPSPPFDSHPIKIPTHRLHVPQPESMANPAANGWISEREHEARSTLYGSRAQTSPYNPRYNTLATGISNAPSIHTHSSSYHTHPKPTSWKSKAHEQREILSDPHYCKCSKTTALKTSKKALRSRRHGTREELGKSDRRWYQNPRICLQDPLENKIDLLWEESSSEPPAARSSCHGSPHRHNPTSVSRSASCHLGLSRVIPLNYICPDQLQESRTGSGKESNYQRESHLPTARSRRRARPHLMREQEGKTRPRVPNSTLHAPRPHWMKHYKDCQDHGLWLPQQQPSSLLSTPHNQQGPHVEHDQAVARHLALKYGFCPACGVQKSLKQPRIPGCAPYGNQQKSRYTQTEWDDLNSSINNSLNLTYDPTPSMSWDNLTPDPSPVLTNTLEDSRALEALADVADGGETLDELSTPAGVQVDHVSGGEMAHSVQYPGESSSCNGE
ncbi:uncharacterized protein [Panulirus ornatus]|uniref:uncharacterized protein isoform X2 n=1 Tax=Panulirus ornatus TaxID=150431 RepID=UPI003A8A1733